MSGLRQRQPELLEPKPRKPLRARPRGKGNRGERAVVDLLVELGWSSARRNFASGGQGGGDIVNGPQDTYIEVRHRESWRIPAWLEEVEAKRRPTDLGILAFRRNRSEWYAAIPLRDLLELLRERDVADS